MESSYEYSYVSLCGVIITHLPPPRRPPPPPFIFLFIFLRPPRLEQERSVPSLSALWSRYWFCSLVLDLALVLLSGSGPGPVPVPGSGSLPAVWDLFCAEERGRRPAADPSAGSNQQEEDFSPAMQKVEGRGTPVHLPAPGGPSTPGSPAPGIMARVNDQVVGYRDLAALPRDKAILQVERPDLMTYQPHLTFSSLDPPRRQRSLSPPASSPTMFPEVKEQRAESDSGSPAGSTLTLQAGRRSSQQHFHRPDIGMNLYRKPPIYKQDVNKHMEVVVQSAKFPAAQPPDPNLPSKIETEFWPCPPSLAAMEIEWRKKKELQEEDEFEDLTGDAEMLQEQALEKIKSNLGRLILKEEKEKALHFRRKTQSLPDRTHMHGSLSAAASKSPSHSGPGLTRMQSAEFSTDGDKEQAAAEVSMFHACRLTVSGH
ncbi:dematin isoform X1 [Clinocottus analis]|uniref:dematin isoform X1 n=1 Tax=Clinocottus analis TaxID=304258 RepID=UPI0035C09CD8